MESPARAVSPVAHPRMILWTVDELQSRSSTICRGGPRSNGFVTHDVDHLVLVGAGARLDQRDLFSVWIKISIELTEHRDTRTIGRREDRAVLGDYDELFVCDDCSLREGVI